MVEKSVEMNLKKLDPRVFQIVFLGSFLTLGVLLRDFSVQATQIASVFVTSLATQWFWLRRLNIRQAGYLSAIVTSFGISLLVRADSWWVHPLLASAAISSKFVFRIDQAHVFNPANLAAVLAAWVLPGAWLSPGQWGQSWLAAGWFIALGMIVTRKSRQIDLSLVFLACFASLIITRVLVLGQNPLIIGHQLQSGALLLFTFFMISDPLTTPRHSAARIGYAVLVALLAYWWQFILFKPNGLILALFLASFVVPLLNRVLPAKRFNWQSAQTPTTTRTTG